MDKLARRRKVQRLGERAIEYYVDTGLCVFCAADDCARVPHDDHCDVGELAGVVVDEERITAKAEQRAVIAEWLAQQKH